MIKDKYSSYTEFEKDVLPNHYEEQKKQYLKEKKLKSLKMSELFKN
ncbi:hypothetical protein [Methanolapillus africanus]